ncbi:MAG: sigma-70 family RNA polymerase sigma factor [Rhodococcus sp. (in: high G+C Gram-positive bacteria)]|nr:sigma-70 family RNA polymerase sigma factor [Rhodococcus sp. (in: high G+C Gram-positive bacteria)]
MHRSPRPPGRPGDDDGCVEGVEPDLEPSDATAQIDVWLEDADIDLKDDRLQRRGGDEELLLTLQLGGFAKQDWDPVAQELARYGLAVVTSWIRSRTIFTKVKQRTGYGLPVLDDWPNDPEVVNDVATDTVVAALEYFRDNILMKNRWDPSKGASIRTYFIGQCLFKFANCYRKIYETERTRRAQELLTDDDTITQTTMRGIEGMVVTTIELREAIASVTTAHARVALMLHSQGYKYDEIADRLGVPGGAKKVENMISYQRRLLRRAQ